MDLITPSSWRQFDSNGPASCYTLIICKRLQRKHQRRSQGRLACVGGCGCLGGISFQAHIPGVDGRELLCRTDSAVVKDAGSGDARSWECVEELEEVLAMLGRLGRRDNDEGLKDRLAMLAV